MNQPTENYLINDFYSVVNKKETESGFTAAIAFKSNHWIYNCHFRNMPITPGACLVQIVRELVSDHLDKPAMIHSIKNIKFLNVLGNDNSGDVLFDIRFDTSNTSAIPATVSIDRQAQCFAKISLILGLAQ